MGLRFRKSIKICKGVKINLGTKGASVSFGTRGLRHTIHTSGKQTSSIGLPGTGLSYVKVKGAGSKKRTNMAMNNQGNAASAAEYEAYVEGITSLHKKSDEKIEWKKLAERPEPVFVNGIGPKQREAITLRDEYKPSLMESAFGTLQNKRADELKEAVEKARQEDERDYEEWKTVHNIASGILSGDIDMYLDVINEMDPLDDLLEYGAEFEFGSEDPKIIEVEFTLKTAEVVPKYSVEITKTGKLSEKELSKSAYFSLMQDYLCSCSLRIARDMFALLPVEKVIVHAVETLLNKQTGHTEEVTVLSVEYQNDILQTLNFERLDPSDALNNFNYNMKFSKTNGFQPVVRINDL